MLIRQAEHRDIEAIMSIVRSVLDVRNPREMRAKIFEEYPEQTPVEKFNKKGIIAL